MGCWGNMRGHALHTLLLTSETSLSCYAIDVKVLWLCLRGGRTGPSYVHCFSMLTVHPKLG